MKRLTLLCVCLSGIIAGHAQWNTNGSHIYNSNAGYVGVGTSSPIFNLDVTGTFRASSFVTASEYLTLSPSPNSSYRVALNAQNDGYITGRDAQSNNKF